MLVCATLFWAGNFNIGKFAFIESISPFTLAFLRWLLVWIILMPLTYREILDKLVSIDTLDAGFEQLNAGEVLDPQYVNRRNITAREIRQYRVKGTWYFNKT